jgi:eukaryotic-like serine/threonine-protein kinase
VTDSPQTPTIGSTLFERYKILSRLGAGGMGVVFEAFDERRDLRIALKTLERPSSEKILILKREFRAASEFRHLNLLRLYDLVALDPLYFLTMELVENGVDLHRYIQGQGGHEVTPTSLDNTSTAIENTREIDLLKTTPYISINSGRATFHKGRLLHTFPQVCAALSTLHQGGLVHRDLKPDNILVNQSGVVKLLDFGISQSSRVGQEASNLQVSQAGTPNYMSPEQARGEKMGPASDLYSLGVILYELLTGVLPFTGSTTNILLGHMGQAPLTPSKRVVGIPIELERLCLALLSKDPSKRPDLLRVVEQFTALGGTPVVLEARQPRRFVGRGAEIKRIEVAAERAHSGEQSIALVRGESGSGKSALCAEVAHTMEATGWLLISSRCYERELIPYNALDPVLDAVAVALKRKRDLSTKLPADIGILAAMFPALCNIAGVKASEQRQSATEGRQRAVGALRQLLHVFRGDRPLALWVDDLQWADADSLYLLSALFIKNELPSFLLLGSLRTGAPSPKHPLSVLTTRPEVSMIDLSPFGEAEIRSLFGAHQLKELQQIAIDAQGNAFFATELLSALLRGESLKGDLSSLLTARFQALSEHAHRIVEVLAVNGASASFRSLRRCTGITAPALSAALDFLMSAHWIKSVEISGELEDAVDLYHSRIRDVVEATLPQDRRQELHKKLAVGLAESNGEPEVIAGHYLAAKDSQAATPWLLVAARKAASQLAPERADLLYQQALQTGGASWPEAQIAREERARVIDRSGVGYQAAASAFREAAAHTEGYPAVRLLLGAAEADLKNGEVEAALSAGTQALAPYERMRLPVGLWGSLAESGVYLMRAEWRLLWLRKLPGRKASEVHSATHYLFHRLSVVLSSFDLLRSMVLAGRSLALALSHGSDEDIVDALALYSVFIAMRRGKSNLRRAERLMSRCLAWRKAVKDPELDIWIDESSAILNVLTGDFSQARDKLPICLERYRSLGRLAGVEIVSNLAYQALAEAALGNPRAGVDCLRASLQHALSARDLFFLRSVIPTATWMHLLVGDLAAAKALASETPEEAKSASNPTSMPLIYYEAALALANGDQSGAISRLEKLLSAPLRNGLVFFGEPRIRSHLLLSAAFLAESRHAHSPALRKKALSRARAHTWKVLNTGDPTLEGIAFRMAGLIEAAQHSPKAALRWLGRAVLSLENRGEIIELAAALLARGFIASNASDTKRGLHIIEMGAFMDPAAREGHGWSWR